MWGSSHCRSLMVNPIPNCLIVQPRSDTTSNRKYQLTVECLPQKFKDFSAFLIVRQIRCSWSPSKIHPISFARVHVIIYDNGAFSVSRKSHCVIHSHIHLSFWLISRHCPENSRTDWALGPVFLSNEIFKTADVEFMRTCKHIDIILIFLVQFIEEVFFVFYLKFAEANRTLFLLHFAIGQIELKRGKVLQSELLLDFSCIVLILFVGEENIGLDLVVMFLSLIESVGLVKFNFKTIVVFLSNSKRLPLLIFEHGKFIWSLLLFLCSPLFFRIFIKEFEQIHRTNFIIPKHQWLIQFWFNWLLK